MARLHQRRLRVAALVVVAGFVVASCGDDDGESSTATSSTAPSSTTQGSSSGSPTTGGGARCAHSGGTLDVGVFSPPSGLDPVRLAGDASVGADELAAFYDTLMYFDNDSFTYEPRLAKSLE